MIRTYRDIIMPGSAFAKKYRKPEAENANVILLYYFFSAIIEYSITCTYSNSRFAKILANSRA